MDINVTNQQGSEPCVVMQHAKEVASPQSQHSLLEHLQPVWLACLGELLF